MVTAENLDNAYRIIASLGASATKDEVRRILDPILKELGTQMEQASKTMLSLAKGSGDWRFSLGDGVTAYVTFQGGIRKQHLAAFVKVFSVMAESYVETIDEAPKENTDAK